VRVYKEPGLIDPPGGGELLKFVGCVTPPTTSQFRAAALAEFVVVPLKMSLIRKVPDI
jgi:hypothetical protein